MDKIAITKHETSLDIHQGGDKLIVKGEPTDLNIVENDKLTLDQTEVELSFPSDKTSLTLADPKLEILEVSKQGPAGPPGTGGGGGTDYDILFDEIDEHHAYKGEALPGTQENDLLWRISYLTLNLDGTITTTHPDASTGFLFSWTQRASYDYS
jgi:hypothetical protein